MNSLNEAPSIGFVSRDHTQVRPPKALDVALQEAIELLCGGMKQDGRALARFRDLQQSCKNLQGELDQAHSENVGLRRKVQLLEERLAELEKAGD